MNFRYCAPLGPFGTDEVAIIGILNVLAVLASAITLFLKSL
ncbi:hypothetical protein AB1J05_07570 [Staphylococcus cohnii species complex 1658]|nr:hypothetical protein [Staphylococcus cohnii]